MCRGQSGGNNGGSRLVRHVSSDCWSIPSFRFRWHFWQCPEGYDVVLRVSKYVRSKTWLTSLTVSAHSEAKRLEWFVRPKGVTDAFWFPSARVVPTVHMPVGTVVYPRIQTSNCHTICRQPYHTLPSHPVLLSINPRNTNLVASRSQWGSCPPLTSLVWMAIKDRQAHEWWTSVAQPFASEDVTRILIPVFFSFFFF